MGPRRRNAKEFPKCLQESTVLRGIATEYCYHFYTRVLSSSPPHSRFPDDLEVPYTDYCDIVACMSKPVQVAVGQQALKHFQGHLSARALRNLREEADIGNLPGPRECYSMNHGLVEKYARSPREGCGVKCGDREVGLSICSAVAFVTNFDLGVRPLHAQLSLGSCPGKIPDKFGPVVGLSSHFPAGALWGPCCIRFDLSRSLGRVASCVLGDILGEVGLPHGNANQNSGGDDGGSDSDAHCDAFRHRVRFRASREPCTSLLALRRPVVGIAA